MSPPPPGHWPLSPSSLRRQNPFRPHSEPTSQQRSSASGAMLWVRCLPLSFLLLDLAVAHVFLNENDALQVLRPRQRRANSFLEELKQGDMERECVEEKCSWEEAREIFEDEKKTNDFWAVYLDGDACESKPCMNGGQCKDGIGSYSCYCQTGYKGFNCEIVIPALCEIKNGGCAHYCKVARAEVTCSCADGYFLDFDDKSCISNEPFKCGAIISSNTRSILIPRPVNRTEETDTFLNQTDTFLNQTDTFLNQTESGINLNATLEEFLDLLKSNNNTGENQEDTHGSRGSTRIVGGQNCNPSECPWQALLLDRYGVGFCGGTILTNYIILTAAHCMNETNFMRVRLGEFDMLANDGSEQTLEVQRVFIHKRYLRSTSDNDIALIKLRSPIIFSKYRLPACLPDTMFAEKVLMQQPGGLVSGFGRLGEGRQQSTILQRLSVPYVDRDICIESANLRVTTNMFCAGYDRMAKDACQGDSGGPHVTKYGDTYFVTGIVSWGEGCARQGKYGVYTQVSKYTRWIREGMSKLMTLDRVRRQSGAITRLYL